MDWPESTEPLIVAFPRGRQRDRGAAAGNTVVEENPLRWTSRYGSLVTTVYGSALSMASTNAAWACTVCT